MRHFIQPGSLALALIGAACGMEGGMGGAAQLAAAHDALAAREQTHYDACMAATQSTDMSAETAAYHEGVEALSTNMMAACQTMMGGGGMMGRHGDVLMRMGDVTESMRDEIVAHHTRMDATSSVGEMHTECTAHHGAMGNMLDQMQTMMDGGMM